MDTLIHQLAPIMNLVGSNGLTVNAVLLILGTVLPFIVGIVLPRRHTISYGGILYKILGGLMLQKRVHTPATDLIGKIALVVRSTFVDLSFGVYLASRSDLTPEAKEEKIKEFLALTQSGSKEPAEPEAKP